MIAAPTRLDVGRSGEVTMFSMNRSTADTTLLRDQPITLSSPPNILHSILVARGYAARPRRQVANSRLVGKPDKFVPVLDMDGYRVNQELATTSEMLVQFKLVYLRGSRATGKSAVPMYPLCWSTTPRRNT